MRSRLVVVALGPRHRGWPPLHSDTSASNQRELG